MNVSRRGVVVAVALALGAALAAPWAVGRGLAAREDNAVLRGARLAERLGCGACHLPPAGAAIPNPGSRWGSVPRFGGGNVFMYVDQPAEVAEWIRDGAPRRWLADPEIRARLAGQAIRMPAFGGRIDDARVADLAAWVRAVEGLDAPGDVAAGRGREIAARQGCTGCHGPAGAGGHRNPGALGGIVPGFLGANFPDLVRDEAEFREWVLTGTSERLGASPIARWAWRRQAIAMPAYQGRLTAGEVADLWAWIQAERTFDRSLGRPDERQAPADAAGSPARAPSS